MLTDLDRHGDKQIDIQRKTNAQAERRTYTYTGRHIYTYRQTYNYIGRQTDGYVDIHLSTLMQKHSDLPKYHCRLVSDPLDATFTAYGKVQPDTFCSNYKNLFFSVVPGPGVGT